MKKKGNVFQQWLLSWDLLYRTFQLQPQSRYTVIRASTLQCHSITCLTALLEWKHDGNYYITSSLTKHKLKRHYCPQISNAIGSRERKQLGRCHKCTLAPSVSLNWRGTVGEGENKERLCLSETNHVGMSKNTAKKGRKRVERVHGREKSKQARRMEDGESLMVVEVDGVQQGIPDSNAAFEEEDHLLILVLPWGVCCWYLSNVFLSHIVAFSLYFMVTHCLADVTTVMPVKTCFSD